MTEAEALAKVQEVLTNPECAKAVRAVTGMGIHFETMGWSAEQYRAEILRLRLALAEFEDFDV